MLLFLINCQGLGIVELLLVFLRCCLLCFLRMASSLRGTLTMPCGWLQHIIHCCSFSSMGNIIRKRIMLFRWPSQRRHTLWHIGISLLLLLLCMAITHSTIGTTESILELFRNFIGKLRCRFVNRFQGFLLRIKNIPLLVRPWMLYGRGKPIF